MRIMILSLLLLLFSSSIFAAEKGLVLNINGPIGPAAQDYLERGIAKALKEEYALVLLQLNTPGGLDTSMRGMNNAILAAPIPIITYVTPSGARAASAGVFILYASHLSAMTPGTHVGAASPVNLMRSSEEAPKETSTEAKKAMNDASSYIRSLAEFRRRNADWGEKAVREAASIPATEAKKLGVIDELADNPQQLLQKINDRKVMIKNQTKILKTSGLTLEALEPGWRYEFLSFLTNPNIIYLLILITIYGLFFEFSNPGLILPGVAGLIALFLVLYALQLMPINYAGLMLVLVGIVFMMMEFFISSFGIIGIGGLIAFIIGSIMLFDINDNNLHIAWTLIFSMSLLTALFFFLALGLAVKSHRKSIITGQEGLIGSEGIVINVSNEKIIVRVLGELWEAKAAIPLMRDDKIKVTAITGLTLSVEPLSNQIKSGEIK